MLLPRLPSRYSAATVRASEGDIDIGGFLAHRAHRLLLRGEELVETAVREQGHVGHAVTREANVGEGLEQPNVSTMAMKFVR